MVLCWHREFLGMTVHTVVIYANLPCRISSDLGVYIMVIVVVLKIYTFLFVHMHRVDADCMLRSIH